MPRLARGPVMRLPIAILIALSLSIATLGSVWAHANFERSDPAANSIVPAAPDRVRAWFTEAPDPKRSSLEVYDAQRQLVSSGATSVDPSNPKQLSVAMTISSPGVYTVAWKTVSLDDGDAASGFFAFGVGSIDAAGEPQELGPLAADDLQVSLSVAPAAVGTNSARVTLRDSGGQPVEATLVRLKLTPPPPDIGQVEIQAEPAEPGTFALPSLLLGLPGDWTVEVRVRRSGVSDSLASFTLPVAAAAPQSSGATVATSAPAEPTSATLPAPSAAASESEPAAALSPSAVAQATPTSIALVVQTTSSSDGLALSPAATPTLASATGPAQSGSGISSLVLPIALVLLLVIGLAIAAPALRRRR